MFEQFKLEVEKLINSEVVLTVDEKNEMVDKLCESYVEQTGTKPDSYQLSLLANWILEDDIKNKATNKVRTVEYNFHSHRQSIRRNRKEVITQDDTMDFLHSKYHKRLDSVFKKKTQDYED
jgi:hypothetical protein